MSEQDEPGYVSAQEIVDAMNARYRCGKEDGRQEVLAQVREYILNAPGHYGLVDLADAFGIDRRRFEDKP